MSSVVREAIRHRAADIDQGHHTMRTHLARVLAFALAGTAVTALPSAAVADTCTPTTIEAVQGTGDETPLMGQSVEVTGVVTSMAGSRDFRLEQVDFPDGDDPAASNAVLVDDYSANTAWPALSIGDVVTVCGAPGEFRDRTNIADVDSIVIAGTAPVPASDFTLPASEDLEAYESMYLAVDAWWYVNDIYNAERFDEIGVSGRSALRVPTDVHEPGSTQQQALAAENDRNLLELPLASWTLDDILNAGDSLRWGDQVQVHANGFIEPNFGDMTFFRADGEEFGPEAFKVKNARPDAPDVGDPDVVVASMNVYNYWTSIDYYGGYADCVESTGGDVENRDDQDTAQPVCGPAPRGARGTTQLENQQDALYDLVTGSGADVVALQELETPGLDLWQDGGAGTADETLESFVGMLNDRAGENVWDFVPMPDDFLTHNTNPIHSGFVYRVGTVEPVGTTMALDELAPVYDRLPVAATFARGDEEFTVVNLHLKSKGCTDASGPDEDQGDGQSCFNATRTTQMQAVAAWVADLSETSEDIIVAGDFNSYRMEDPLDVLRDGSALEDLVAKYVQQHERYSYVFFGQAGSLDHAWGSESIADALTGVEVWHTNSVESNDLSYFGRIPDASRWRASDHDAIVIGLDLDDRRGGGERRRR